MGLAGEQSEAALLVGEGADDDGGGQAGGVREDDGEDGEFGFLLKAHLKQRSEVRGQKFSLISDL
jgi:hypothetical protein